MIQPNMQLLFSPRSPFVRKVRIVLYETGLTDQVDMKNKTVAINLATDPEVLAVNPLGKLPVLITPQGLRLFDSCVICEYLDQLATGGLFPIEPEERINHLRLQALADGMTDILLLWRTELMRPEGGSSDIRAAWLQKVRAAMSELDRLAPGLSDSEFRIGHAAVACALGQLDFRWPDCAWRSHFPALAALDQSLSPRPSVEMTRIPDEFLLEGAEVTQSHLTFSS